MARWSVDQVAGAAPDASSLAAARKLAKPGPWSEAGSSDTLVWGRCQGSGKTPYQVSVDVVAPAYRCSCPSRKFPCKHALALLLLWAQGGDEGLVSATQPADFAQEWAAERADRSARAAAKATAGQAPVDPAAQAERLAARLAAMDAGIEDFSTWLRDLVRDGTAAARGRDAAWFERAAARLVDAQCPALAAEVRELPATLYAGENWTDATLDVLGRWWTLTRAWQRRDTLDEAALADLRVALGWNRPTAEVREGEPITDVWLVLGAHRDERGRLAEQRTWLRGLGTGETVLLLDFAAGGQALPVPQVTGAALAARVIPYPGSAPRRGLLLDDAAPAAPAPYPRGEDVAGALDAIAAHRAADPLALRTPLLLEVVVTPTHVVDLSGAAFPLVGATPWEAVAASGGRPVTCFGEWTAAGFLPLALALDAADGAPAPAGGTDPWREVIACG